MDLKNIISNKTHETSLKTLKDVPSTLQDYLTYDFLNSIASALTAITKDQFNYTGKTVQEGKTLRITFTTSSQTDTIDLLIIFETGGMKFVNINQKLEKALDVASPVEDEVVVVKPIITKKKVVKKKEPNLNLDPSMFLAMTKVIDDDKKKEEEDKKKQMMNALNSALETLEVREEFKKKEGIIDLLLKQETDD